MASGSKLLPRQQPRSLTSAAPSRFWKLLQLMFWSPSLILAAMVHVLCQPLTKRVLIAAVVLDIPLQWGAHLGLREGVGAVGAMDGFDISITTLALVGLYIGWLFTERVESRPLRIVWNWPIATYTIIVVASLFVASDLLLSLFQVFLMLEMLLLYLYFAANITSRDDIRFILRVILVGGIVESAYMLVLSAVGHEFGFVRTLGLKTVIYLPVRPGDVTRYGGTIGSPNYAAFYLATVITLAIAVWKCRGLARLRRLTIPLVILSVPALVLTLSRGGWLEVILSIGIFFGAFWIRSGISFRRAAAFVGVLGVLLLCLYLPGPVSRRLNGSDNGSAYSRLPLMQLAGHIIAANPILGVGANNFAAVMTQYEGPEFRHDWIYTVHNQFLLVWSETGMVGLAAYLWIYGSLLRRGWRLWRAQDALFAPLGLGIVAALCGLLFHMFVEAFSARALIQLVWILAAIIGACEVIQRSEAAEPVNPKTEICPVEAQVV